MDLQKKIEEAIAELDKFPDEKKIKLKSKLYVQVKDRNHIFRKHFGLYLEVISEYELIEPTILNVGSTPQVLPGSVICKTYCKHDGKILAVGIAEAQRNSAASKVIEKTQTVSLGRMLALLGLDGGEIASYEEIAAFHETSNPPQQASIKNSGIMYTNKGEANNDIAKITVDNVVPLHNIETSALVEEASSFELIKERLVEAIHLGKLEQIYTQNKNIIDNNEDLLRIYKNRKESINEWQ